MQHVIYIVDYTFGWVPVTGVSRQIKTWVEYEVTGDLKSTARLNMTGSGG